MGAWNNGSAYVRPGGWPGLVQGTEPKPCGERYTIPATVGTLAPKHERSAEALPGQNSREKPSAHHVTNIGHRPVWNESESGQNSGAACK